MAGHKISFRFLLLGKTGSGKSSTGNSILGYKYFKTSASGDSVTENIETSWVEFDSHEIKVIDGPGLEDTKLNTQDDRDRTIRNMSVLMYKVHNSLSAFLFTISYGERFTAEDRSILESLKAILGPNFLKDYGIVVVTRGDSFETAKEEGEVTDFKAWLQGQQGALGDLFQECSYRCVLFNNREKDEVKKFQQIQELLRYAEIIHISNKSYTNEHFQKFAAKREELMLELQSPELKEEFERRISLLLSEIRKLGELPRLENIVMIQERAKDVLKEIHGESKDSEVLHKCQQQVQDILGILDNLKQNCNVNNVSGVQSDVGALQHAGQIIHQETSDKPFLVQILEFGAGVLGMMIGTIASRYTGGASQVLTEAGTSLMARSFTNK